MTNHSTNNVEKTEELSPTKRALLALKQMQAKLSALENAQTEPIAIIGMSCRFPGGGNNPEAFWQMLRDGVNTATEVPKSRWDIKAYYDSNPDAVGKIATRYANFLDQVEEFDPNFFGISPREAVVMDPQQRLLLEVSWESLENAGLSPEKLRGSQTGVFLGIMNQDYSHFLINSPGFSRVDRHTASGNEISAASGRLAYFFGLHGPTVTLDTACSSSLVALHLACQSLRGKECNLALVCGVNLILTPYMSVTESSARMLAQDGRCKTFDAAADGYGRGEGCGAIAIKRLSDAIADQDNILAVIRGSAINQDGRSSGLTVPNGPAQEQLIRQALAMGGIDPQDVSYVECHGTGTPLGDPIEVEALASVYGNRPAHQPLMIGSAKTNIGHLEGAAGIAGLIKLVLALQHQEIPPHLHYQQPNPRIPWDELPMIVPTQTIPWTSSEKPRLAGLSSFGFSGTNAHVILAEAPPPNPVSSPLERPSHLLTLSAKTESALRQLVTDYQQYLALNTNAALADICFTANTGRSHFEHRLSIVADTTAELREKLTAFITQPDNVGVGHNRLTNDNPAQVAFLFTGQGSQYKGMGQQLYETQPTFRAAMERCDQILRPYLPLSLLSILYSNTEPSALNQTAYTQPALFALNYSLYHLWQSWGVTPSILMGHSVGEYVAACVAGVFSLEDGLKLIAERGRLMQNLPQNGQMVVVFADEAQVQAAIQPYPGDVAIAAINGAKTITLSGKRQALSQIVDALAAKGVKTQELKVSHAFHSPLMQPMLAAFEQVAQTITYSSPRIDLVSNVTGEIVTHEIATPEYWCNHILKPVRFAAGIRTLAAAGYHLFVECGPQPTLLGMGRQILTASDIQWLPSLRPGQAEWSQLLQSLGALYVKGVAVDWFGFDRDYGRHRLQLPTYPFQRQRYWLETTGWETPLASGSSTETQQITPVVNLINAGKTEELAQLLTKTGNFSADQISLLRPMLAALVKQNQHPVNSSQDLLYEIKWRPQSRFGHQPQAPTRLNLQDLAVSLHPQRATLMAESNINGYEATLIQIEAKSLDSIKKAFQDMGWDWQLGQCFSTNTMAEKMGVVSQHRQLLRRWLEILADVGVLQPVGADWQVTQIPVISTQDKATGSPDSDVPAEMILMERCGAKLASVMKGECDPLQLLFPQGDLTTTSQIYAASPDAQVTNGLLQRAVLSAWKKRPSGTGVRILEIGAGTGGTTAHLLPHLNPHSTEYVYTDIGHFFLSQAAEKFKDYPFVTYQSLDIEQDPISQGFAAHQYDLIVAANVLHATRDLQNTLTHVQQLLAPGGMLLLVEVTVPQRWLDLTFGLTEGWWRFQDRERRPNYPLLSAQQWQELLGEVGFADRLTMGTDRQSVIVAQMPEMSRDLGMETKTADQHWLILCDRQGVGQELATQLRCQKQVCTLVFPGENYQQITEAEFQVNPANANEFQQLLQAITEANPVPLHQVIHLWSLDAVESPVLTPEELAAASRLGCGSTLHLLQALVNTKLETYPSLWLVTQEAQPIGTEAKPLAIAQSPLWGMGKVIALEHPQLWGGMIDLASNDHDPAITLLAEIENEDGENQIAFRDKQRYVPRLVPSQPAQVSGVPIQSDQTYLITGGLGFLGLKTAQWMVEKGARHLVIVGRRGLPERNTWASLNQNTDMGKTVKAIESMEKRGATVLILSADICNPTQMSGVLAQIKNTPFPLRGIIHAAGVGGDQVLQEMDLNTLESVLRPKTIGTLNLHQLTQQISLDFFVGFSSAGSVWGAKGQGHYDAANHFLDVFAHYRHSIGLPGLSINWGLLEAGGVVSEDYYQTLTRIGLETLTPEQGFEVLADLLGTDRVQTTIAKMNWSQFKTIYERWSSQSLLKEIGVELEEPEKRQQTSEPTTILQNLRSASVKDAKALLMAHVQEQVRLALGRASNQLPEIQQGFFDMGMDSLIAIDLKNRLETSLNCSLPATLAFDFPNTLAVVEYLLPEVLKLEESEVAPNPAPERKHESTHSLETLTQISEQDLAALIANKFGEYNNLK